MEQYVKRTNGYLTPIFTTCTQNGSSWLWNHYPQSSISMPQGFTGYRNPAYIQQIATHSSATTPFSGYVYTVSESKPIFGEIQSKLGLKPWTYSWNTSSTASAVTWDMDAASTTAADNEARTRFYQKMQTKFSGGTALGELRETLQMIKKPAVGLRKGIDAYYRDAYSIRRQLSRAGSRHRDYRKAVSELWLEYRFGWKPLIQDIDDGFEAFKARLYEPCIEKFRVRSSRTKVVSVSNLSPYSNSAGYRSDGVARTVKYTSTAQYAGAIYTPINTTSSIPETLGLVPSEFIPTAWELLPYSFLIDYFINIGDILSAYFTASRLRYVYCQRTIREINECTVTDNPVVSPNYTGSVSSGRTKIVSKLVTRGSIAFVPIPGLTLSTSLGAFRAANIAALVHLRGEDARFKSRGK